MGGVGFLFQDQPFVHVRWALGRLLLSHGVTVGSSRDPLLLLLVFEPVGTTLKELPVGMENEEWILWIHL